MKKYKKLLLEKFIYPYLSKNTNYIGVEIEYPLISLDNQINTKSLIISLFDYLKSQHNFTTDAVDVDGNAISVKNDFGDKITLEGRYEIIEFALQKDLNINNIAKRFFNYFEVVQAFLQEHKCFLTGIGTNLTDNPSKVNLLDTGFCRAIHEYVDKFSTYRNPKYFLTNMQSIQTHVEVFRNNFSDLQNNGDALIKTLNLFNKLDFVRAILFSNSLPNLNAIPSNMSYPNNILCARDFNWKNSQFPNTGTTNEEFGSLDELVDYLSSLELFFKFRNGQYEAFNGPTISEYFSNPNQVDDVLDIFRYLKNVVLNSYATVEIRSDCTQPLKDTFAPVAFNVGIANKVEEANEITTRFLQDNKILLSNSTLRDMAINDIKIVEDNIMRTFIQELYGLSKVALEERGFGEEQHLLCLQERIDTLQCPAKKQKRLLEKGVTLDKILRQCSEL